jgi:hypothetical protein
MKQTTSIIQPIEVRPGAFTTVTPPPKCFRCTISFFDEANTGSARGFIATTESLQGYTFTTFFETDGAAPTINYFQGILNAPLVLDRRGVGYMIDNLICSSKSVSATGCTFVFVWEIEI